MTCQHCETRSGVFDMTKTCCAARFLLGWPGDQSRTAEAICERYGHSIESLRDAARKQRAARLPT